MRKLMLAVAAMLLVPVSAWAVPVIQFAQTSNANTIVGTANGAQTSTTIVGNNVAITITQDLGGFLGGAFFSLNAASIGAATPIGTGALQHFGGTFSITSGLNGTGTNYLSGVFTDAVFGAGQSLTMSVSSPPDTLVLSSSLILATQLSSPVGVAFSFTNVTPPVAICGTTLCSFAATVSGNASATPQSIEVPEPGSVLVFGAGLLGVFGFAKRRQGVALGTI